MLRTALLGGNSITLDADMSKYIETLSEQGVIEGLEVSSGSVAPGKAWVKATRSNGETIMVLVQNTEVLAVDTSGTKKIWLEIRQEAIDNGALNNEDGTGIASIKTGPTLPSQNSLLLASVDNGRLTDQRAMIPKIQSVAQRTSTLENKVQRAEGNIERLEEATVPEFLGKSFIVGEKYDLNDEVVFNPEVKIEDCTEELAIGSNNENVNIEIPFIHNGGSLTYLDILAQREGTMSYGLDCHFYEAEVITINGINCFKRTGGLVVGSSVASVDGEKKVIRITPNAPINKPRGTKMVAVIFPRNNVISSSNYFKTFLNPNLLSESLSPVAKNIEGQYQSAGRKAIYAKSDGFENTIGNRYYRREIVNVNKKEASFGATYPGDTELVPVQIPFQATETIARIKGKIKAHKRGGDDTAGRADIIFYETQVFLRANNDVQTVIELARFPERQGNVSGGTVEFDFIAKVVPGATYKLFFYSPNRRKFWHDVELSVEGIVEKKNTGLIHYPIEVKNIGEKGTFATSGHINGRYCPQKYTKILINKTIEGDASAVRYAPADGLLEIDYQSYQFGAKFDNQPLLSYDTNYIPNSMRGKIHLYVEKGNHTIQTSRSTYNSFTGNSRITLTHFIPFQ